MLECKHMKRVVEAHEEILLAVELLQLHEMMKAHPTEFLNESAMNFESVHRRGGDARLHMHVQVQITKDFWSIWQTCGN